MDEPFPELPILGLIPWALPRPRPGHHHGWPGPLARPHPPGWHRCFLPRKENKLDTDPQSAAPASVNKAVSIKREDTRGLAVSEGTVVSRAVRGLVTITVRAQSAWWRSVTWPGPAWGRTPAAAQPRSHRAAWGHPCPSVCPERHGRAAAGTWRMRGAPRESRSAPCLPQREDLCALHTVGPSAMQPERDPLPERRG